MGSLYNMSFKVDKNNTLLCSKMLSLDEVE